MKKTKILIPLALTMLLAGCGVDDSSVPSSPVDQGSDTSSVTPSDDSSSSTPKGDDSSSSVPSGDSSSVPGGDSSSSDVPGGDSSSSEPTPVDVTIDALETVAAEYKTGVSNIKSGKITHDESGEYQSETYTTKKEYVYGSDKYGMTAKLTDKDDDWGDTVTYLMYDSNGEILTITQNDEGDFVKDDYNYYTGMGTKFENYIEWGTTSYGAEGFFSSVIQYGKKNKNKDFKAYKLNNRVYFSYGWHDGGDGTDPWDYYTVEGSFPICDGYLDSFDVTFKYYDSGDWDYADGVCTLHSDALANNVNEWKIEQTAGERDYTNPVDLDSFNYLDFSLADNDGNVMSDSQGVTMEKGGSVELNVQTTTSTANLNFDTPIISEIIGGEEGDVTIYASRSSDGTMETVTVYGNTAGTFTIKVSTKLCSVTFPVTVNEIKPTYMALRHYTDSPDYDYSTDKVSNGDTINTYQGVIHYFTAYTLPYNANGAIAARLTDNDGDPVNEDEYEISTDTVYPGDDERETSALTVQINASGDYILTIYCEADNSVSQEIYFKVKDASIADMLSAGTYMVRDILGNSNKYSLTFSPTTELEGSIAIVDYEMGESVNGSYSISKVDDEDFYEFFFSGCDVPFDALYVGADLKLYCDSDYSYLECALQGSMAATMPRRWTGSASDDDYTYEISLDLYMSGKASGILTYDDMDYYLDCEYSIKKNSGENAGWTITFVDDGFVDETYFEWFETWNETKTATLSEDLSTLTLTCTECDMTFDMVKAD